jgi:pyruvate dehydrogenase E2 component (dihydrolipoamide acetyltransferase)
MAERVVLPKMGATMTEGTITEWFVQNGESVTANAPLFAFETEKIDTEVTAEKAGRVHIIALVDATVPAGAVVAYILAEGEEPPADAPAPESAQVEASTAEVAAVSVASPGAARTAPVRGARVKASPTAKRLAEEHGLDLEQIQGTGPGERILRGDVEAALTAREAGGVQSPDLAPLAGDLAYRGIRRTVGQRMLQSVQSMAHLTLAMEVDMTDAVKLRSDLVRAWEEDGLRVTYTDMIIKAAALALREHPRLNSRLEEDAIRVQPQIHVGFAVALEEGLIVPVISDADAKPLKEMARESAELAGKARAGTLTPDELTHGTFTVTSLGMFDIDVFTPIINPPQAAILGVGRIVDRPAFVGDSGTQIERRSFLTLSLTFDHRLLDGAPGAEYLLSVRRHLERPYLLLTSL